MEKYEIEALKKLREERDKQAKRKLVVEKMRRKEMLDIMSGKKKNPYGSIAPRNRQEEIEYQNKYHRAYNE